MRSVGGRCRAQGLDRLSIPLALAQKRAEINQRPDVAGPGFDRAVIGSLGFIGAAQLAQRVAQVIVRLGRGWIGGDGVTKASHGIVQPACVPQRGTEIVVARSRLRRQLHRTTQHGHGFLVAAKRAIAAPRWL